MRNCVQEINVDELLGRESIVLDNEELRSEYTGKTILITGGAGSIGSELVYQLCFYNPCKIVVLDQGETPLHQLNLRLKEEFPYLNIDYVLGDVSNRDKIEKIFSENQFDIIYHAAAYKHVPIVEKNPEEGVRVNIEGTKNVAELALEYKVSKFVMVSTDKAVNPKSVMGATKRVAELLVQSLQYREDNETDFMITRFGNVLASNGSVIFTFKKQIEKREPITITHPEISRYFMTISESCKLVLLAGAKAKGGEICVFDMGKPIKILDLAKKMCHLYGLEIGKDIEIKFTGLRDGDKLYEQLWRDNAEVKPMYHNKIWVYRDLHFNFHQFYIELNQLISLAKSLKKKEIIKLMAKILPEYNEI